jgi:hypothetical protein
MVEKKTKTKRTLLLLLMLTPFVVSVHWHCGIVLQAISMGSMSAEGGYNVSGSYKHGKTEWVHITATALGKERTLELYTDMAAPLVVTAGQSDKVAKLLRTEGEMNVYLLNLAPGEAVLLQPVGSAAAAAPVVKAVAWPELDGSPVVNYWGKHKRTHFPPMPPPPPPPPPRPPPPPPPPAVACSGSHQVRVPGYTCYASRCAGDSKPYPAANCGGDLCHPKAKATAATAVPHHNGGSRIDPANGTAAEAEAEAEAEAAAALLALCALVPGGPNATAVAAARCSAYKGCTTVAQSPDYTATHCKPSSDDSSSTGGSGGGGGVCFKYFTSGKAGLSPAASWTAWVASP